MSNYQFIWGNTQSLSTIENNLNGGMRYKNNIWNKMSNIIQVVRNNKISTYHSIKDLDEDVELGRNYFNKEFVKKQRKEINYYIKKHLELFKRLRETNLTKLSIKKIVELIEEISDKYAAIIGYFRGSQAACTQLLIEELQKHVSQEEASILMLSPELDAANREFLDWQKLLKKPLSERVLLKHAEKYPWLLAYHFTIQDSLKTLKQRYEYDKANPSHENPVEEKKGLRKKQEAILKQHKEIISLVKLLQELAYFRMEIKACWAGNDFYLIKPLGELSKRTKIPVDDIARNYLLNDYHNLANGKPLSREEIERRKQCFVALLKDNKISYKSGKEAEELAKKELEELYELKDVKEFKGAVANPGKMTGIARILEANDIERARELRRSFKKGEILITEMTQPAIMDIAKKAGAIVTDEGGMLSHAAIISREFKIPCIVGTQIATKVVKDGDKIEVDANKGIIRIL